MLRIGFVAHNFVRGDGQGRIQCEIVRHAVRLGHRVTLLADQVDADLAAEPGVEWDRIPKWPARPNLLGARSFATAADRRLRHCRSDFDVVVGAGFTLTSPHDVNLCQFVHGAWLRSPVHVARLSRGPWAWYQRAYSGFNSSWERLAFASAKRVVAPSERIRAELISVGVAVDRTAVIYNGVDIDEFRPGSEADAGTFERATLGLPPVDQGPLGMFAGDIRTTRKNLDTVLKAMVEVPNMRLAVAGALESSPFPAMARDLGVAPRVTFLGFRRDVNLLMRAADFFVFPSRYEAGTLVLTEAAASGLPLVTAATAGGAEVFGPEVAEVIGDPDDVPALVRAMRRFTDDPVGRRLAGQAARTVAERLTWTRMAEQYISLFESVAQRRVEVPITMVTH